MTAKSRRMSIGLSAFLAVILVSLPYLGCDRQESRKVPVTAPATSETEIQIGAVLPLTGSAARYGKWIQEGLELARHEVNKAGGINGRPLQIVYEDDEAKPALAASATQKLIDINGVPVIFGSWASSCVLAQAPIAERSRVVLMAEAISPKIRQAGDYVFRIQPDARFYLAELVPFVYQKLGAHTACILYINNDFGVDQARVFQSRFEQLGGQILSREAYLPDRRDFRAQLTKIRSNSPSVVFVPGYAEVGTILKQAKELGISARFVGSVPTENPDLLNVARDAAEGIVYPSHFDPDSQGVLARKFQEAYEARYGRPAEGFAALAYDGLMIISEGLRKCGGNSQCLRDFLYTVKDRPGVTGPTSFDSQGDVIKTVLIKTVSGGRFRAYPPE